MDNKKDGITRGGRIVIGAGIAFVIGATGFIIGANMHDICQPRQVYSADLNDDGKTDYAVKCENCFSSDNEDYILLSSPDGTYSRMSWHGAKGIIKENLEKLIKQ